MYSTVPSLHESATPPSTSPASPTRRLRGLSYLRNYTHNHILSRESSSSTSRPTVGRATSYPSPTSSPGTRGSAIIVNSSAVHNHPRQSSPATAEGSTPQIPTTRPNNNVQESVSSTSGWLPTTGGVARPSAIAASSSSALPSGNSAASDQTASMVRTRSATMGGAADLPNGGGDTQNRSQVNGNNATGHQLPSIRFSAHQDPRAQRPSLVFPPMARILPTGSETIKVGRYSERDNQPIQAVNVPSASPVGFKSKVVSRRHCEFWYTGGRWFIKDVKSSSGTFLNHIRLSSPGTESRPFPVNDGDIVQLGIDFKGGEEMIFRCVKIRVELNKGWQTGPSSFNVQSHKRLRELNNLGKPTGGSSSQDCSICLGPIAPCQSLFVAPCSHTWHYKCIRVIINGPHWPHFICPNCRTVADLEAELDDPYANGEWEEVDPAELAPVPVPEQNTAEGATTKGEGQSNEANEVRVADMARADANTSSDNHSGSSDLEVVDSNDDSGHDHSVDQAAEDLGYMNIEESPSSVESDDSHLGAVPTGATVPPMDIIARKPVANSSSLRLGQSNTRSERDTTRTPSPNSHNSLLLDPLTGVEGPMTPRNDAGPFIFDGSGGLITAIDPQMAARATMNLNAAAETPSPSHDQ